MTIVYTPSQHRTRPVWTRLHDLFSCYSVYHYLFLAQEKREESRDDLDDEIEYQRSKRADSYGSPGISFSGNRKYIENKLRERQAINQSACYV